MWKLGFQEVKWSFQRSHSYLELEQGLLSCGLNCSAMPCKVYISWFGMTRKALFLHFLSGEAERLEWRPTEGRYLKIPAGYCLSAVAERTILKRGCCDCLILSPQSDSWTLSIWVHRDSEGQMTSSGQPWHMTMQEVGPHSTVLALKWIAAQGAFLDIITVDGVLGQVNYDTLLPWDWLCQFPYFISEK